jgi:NAD(P)-dependent dehydrogenase (short-subunit alcohol dehydrogenase family)
MMDAQRTLQSLDGDGHILAEADLADPEATRQMVDRAAAALGRINVVVNNAGVYLPHDISKVSYEEWQRAWSQTLAVNLVGAANVAWCAVRHMPDGGRIINVASRGAFRGEPGQPAYGASKAALVSLGQSLARSLGPRRIAVTTIAPGWVDTDMAAPALDGPSGQRRKDESPLARVAAPEEVAAAIFYLASPEAEFASGTVLDFNGASHLRI